MLARSRVDKGKKPFNPLHSSFVKIDDEFDTCCLTYKSV